ncbi:uncharacterized protein DUF3885 [Cytobacillus horneckiae]|uniref:DUF3885 domain-containing protein n=1 Tax=Cytobacillus horneckiae TaxID=549687 RepID=A0A2N0ZK76_9BACI|nr:DUF3885 domain-containing protein [Cytobacillus horneckiae]MBN6888208.1 DUF3885 domain-containing protein [Cytobacillus horneckiae]MEC1154763.1 DUF3885 domain-containing protein [Cytobacillus horneckiae]MED2940256.1 DUF3885 domain-containing protein [Cytobacillus horneckiae]PKG29893.1 DUF3885 domain-containing protein [Cytobacillus horneckiae]
MELQEYINTTFPGLVLKPSLYYQSNISIHFDLARDLYQFKNETELNPDYFNRVYTQAISLFNDLFSAEDKILLVTNVYQNKDFVRKSKKKMMVYRHYIQNKDVRFRLKQEMLPYMFDDEENTEDYCTSQFSLQCCKQDIRYPLLIKAICNQDFPVLKPRLHNPYRLYHPDVFFINLTNNVIFYIYDDRGCEIIASDIGTIRPIYEKYTDLVNEYFRVEIDQRFK